MTQPDVRQPVPGPKASEVLDQARRYESPATATFAMLQEPTVMARGEGVFAEDPDGNRYLDFVAGFGVLNTGHSHPKVLAAMQEQLRDLSHLMGAANPTRARLMAALSRILPGNDDKRVLFGAGGGEAVDMALRLARTATGRYEVLAFHGAYHGRAHGAMSLMGRGAGRKGFEPMVAGAVHVPYPYEYRNPFGDMSADCGMDCAHFIEMIVKGKSSGIANPAAIFVEPLVGNGGMIPAPADFLREIRRICDETGMLMVVDEIMSGWGRTGQFLAIEHAGVEPDVVILGKAMGGGIPLSAVVTSGAIAQTQTPNRDSSTLAGNPIGCAAALAILKVLEDENLMQKAAEVGAYFLQGLATLKDEFDIIGDVRGRGLMIGVEFVEDRATKAPLQGIVPAVTRYCRDAGLLIYPAGGHNGNVIGFLPPLIIERAHVDTALAILRSAIGRFAAEHRRGA